MTGPLMGNITLEGTHRPAPHHQMHWFTTAENGPNWWEPLHQAENEGFHCLGVGICELRQIAN